MSTIFDAIDRNDLGTVWTMVTEKRDLTTIDEESGMTPLALAAELGHTEIVRILLEEAQVDADHGGATTPLEAAVLEGDLEIVQLLVRSGADVNRSVDEGYTPLMTAASVGARRIARILLEAGARPRARNEEDQTAIDLAFAEGHEELARELRDFSRTRFEAEKAAREERTAREEEEKRARRRARRREAAAKAALGLDHKPSSSEPGALQIEELPRTEPADLRTLEGFDRFLALLERGELSEAVELAESGELDLEARDDAGRTPLMLAAASGALEAVEALLEAGAVVDATDQSPTRDTALVKAIHHPTPQRPEIIRRLVEAGAYLDRQHGRAGMTPLMYAATSDIYLEPDAAEHGDGPRSTAPITSLLLELGAGLGARDLRGHTVRSLMEKASKATPATSPTRRRLHELLRQLDQHAADAAISRSA